MRAEFKYDAPELILLIKDSKNENLFEENIYQKCLPKNYTALSLYVSAKDLKTIYKAIQLLDVTGIIIPDSFQNKHLKLFDKISDLNFINIGVIKNKKFIGINSLSNSYQSFTKKIASKIKGKKIVIWGESKRAKMIRKSIESHKPSQIDLFNFKTFSKNRQKILATAMNSDYFLICTPSDYIIPKSILNTLESKIIDMRGNIEQKNKHKFKNLSVTFTAHLIASNIFQLTGFKSSTLTIQKTLKNQ